MIHEKGMIYLQILNHTHTHIYITLSLPLCITYIPAMIVRSALMRAVLGEKSDPNAPIARLMKAMGGSTLKGGDSSTFRHHLKWGCEMM